MTSARSASMGGLPCFAFEKCAVGVQEEGTIPFMLEKPGFRLEHTPAIAKDAIPDVRRACGGQQKKIDRGHPARLLQEPNPPPVLEKVRNPGRDNRHIDISARFAGGGGAEKHRNAPLVLASKRRYCFSELGENVFGFHAFEYSRSGTDPSSGLSAGRLSRGDATGGEQPRDAMMEHAKRRRLRRAQQATVTGAPWRDARAWRSAREQAGGALPMVGEAEDREGRAGRSASGARKARPGARRARGLERGGYFPQQSRPHGLAGTAGWR